MRIVSCFIYHSFKYTGAMSINLVAQLLQHNSAAVAKSIEYIIYNSMQYLLMFV